MSTLPSSPPIDPARSPDGARHDSRALRVMRNIDLIVLAVALLIFLAAGFPILGWVTGAGAWLGQRLLRDFMASRARKSTDVREQVGYLAGSMIARGWLVSLVILGVGLTTDEDVGLSAAILFVLTFTFYLTMSMITGPFDEDEKAV